MAPRGFQNHLRQALNRARGDEPAITACALARPSAPPVLSAVPDLAALGTLTRALCARDGGTWETPRGGRASRLRVKRTPEGTLVLADAGHGLVVAALVAPHAPRARAASARERLAHAAGEVRALLTVSARPVRRIARAP